MGLFSKIIEGNFGKISDELSGYYNAREEFIRVLNHYHVEFTERQYDSLKYNEDQNYYAQQACYFIRDGLVNNYTLLACALMHVRYGNNNFRNINDSIQANKDEFRVLLFKRGVNQSELDSNLLGDDDRKMLKESYSQMQSAMRENRRYL